ncbi:MAG: hypothetical protein QM589_10335 [Thermomicrobiales bacterium]
MIQRMRPLLAVFMCLALFGSVGTTRILASEASPVAETPVETEVPVETVAPVETDVPAETSGTFTAQSDVYTGQMSGTFTRADQGKTNPTKALQWTVTVASSIGGLDVEEIVPAGANWEFNCSGSWYTSTVEPIYSTCSPTHVYLEYSNTTNVTVSVWGDTKAPFTSLQTFENTAYRSYDGSVMASARLVQTTAATATPAPTNTPRQTNTPAATATSVATNTPAATATSVSTNTPTSTATAGPTNTATSTATAGPTNTPVSTATSVATNTPGATATTAPTNTPTSVPATATATTAPTSTVEPGTAQFGGAFTRDDQGTTNPTKAIKWTFTVPAGSSLPPQDIELHVPDAQRRHR